MQSRRFAINAPLCSIAHIDEKNKAIKQLEDELHVRGVAAARVQGVEGLPVGTERQRATIREGTNQIRPLASRVSSDLQDAQRRARRRTVPRTISTGKELLAELSGLRSELQCVTTQVCCVAD